MKYLFLLCFLFNFNSIWAQQTFEINQFSKQYYAKVTIAKGYENAVFKKGKVQVFDVRNNKLLIEVSADELIVDFDNSGKIKSNVHQLPYGEQSIIIAKDFNFDNQIDLAIMDGQKSCYHLPSFQIYLQKENKLVHSQPFSRLAQEYCGIFQLNPEQKEIITMTKSGCCWHEFSTFGVKDDLPILDEVFTQGNSDNGLTLDISYQKNIDGKMVEDAYQILDLTDIEDKIVFSFAYKNRKRMWLLNQENYLYYVFVDAEDTVELFYQGHFFFHENTQTLRFDYKDTTYSLVHNGIQIKQKDQELFMQSEANSYFGKWEDLVLNNYENVIRKK